MYQYFSELPFDNAAQEKPWVGVNDFCSDDPKKYVQNLKKRLSTPEFFTLQAWVLILVITCSSGRLLEATTIENIHTIYSIKRVLSTYRT